MSEEVLFLSLRPRFARALFDGSKRVELRRTRPRVNPGSRILVYESAPVSALVGILVVDSVVSDSPEKLWESVHNSAGISQEEYREYFSGTKLAHGIFVEESHEFKKTVGLKSLRKRHGDFYPPQSFHYLPTPVAEDLAMICFTKLIGVGS